jgi:hypothetical protein
MDDPNELARRFFALWAEYLAALAADPGAAGNVGELFGVGAALRPPADDARDQPTEPGQTPGAATSARAFGERDVALAELSRRLDDLADRVAALERRGRPPKSSRRRDRQSGT